VTLQDRESPAQELTPVASGTAKPRAVKQIGQLDHWTKYPESRAWSRAMEVHARPEGWLSLYRRISDTRECPWMVGGVATYPPMVDHELHRSVG